MSPTMTPGLFVVIPCYRCKGQILDVLSRMPAAVERVYVVDDACPDGTGRHVEASTQDPRVRVLYHEANAGVGGAMVTGYRAALADRARIVVKLDGDGQMDPAFIPRLIRPIERGEADYAKGNRFYTLDSLEGMPRVRLIGNAVLSFMNKASSGYWRNFDPTNGFTAVHGRVLAHLPLEKVARRYFFESDMLFRLSTLRAVVADVPMDAVYGDEISQMSVSRIVLPFLKGHAFNFMKRLFYNYTLRDFNIASTGFFIGTALSLFGVIYGALSWAAAAMEGETATAGTVMLASLPTILGVQLLVMAVNYDIQNQPVTPIHPDLPDLE